MISLRDKTAIITGASRGIGKATALMFAQAGCHTIINYHSQETAAKEVATAARNFGARSEIFRADVSDKSAVDHMADFTLREFGRIDTLVNNAAIWKEAAIDTMTEAELDEMIKINLCGTFYCTTAVVPQMKRQKSGNIIHISSTAGQRGEAFHSHYAATKGAVISMTKSLAPELAPFNIRVNCVAPGWVETDMSADALSEPDADKYLRLIPMGRAGTPGEIAGAILFLASDLSTFITGEILNVNGGAVLCG